MVDPRVVESERRLCLAVGDRARDLRDVLVKRAADIIVVAEDERFGEVKANRDDVFCILERELLRLLRL